MSPTRRELESEVVELREALEDLRSQIDEILEDDTETETEGSEE